VYDGHREKGSFQKVSPDKIVVKSDSFWANIGNSRTG
jgi:hypothetical protein